MRGHCAMKIDERFDRFSRDLETRQFSQQHGFILKDQRNGKVQIKLSCTHQGQEPERTPASGAQSSNKDVGIDNNLLCSHRNMVNRTASEGNVPSFPLLSHLAVKGPRLATTQRRAP